MTFPAMNLSDSAAFLRFQMAAAVLEKFVAAYPCPLNADVIARKLGIPVMDSTRMCRLLEEAGLLVPATEFQSWNLGKPKGAVTLEDVWNAVGELIPQTLPPACQATEPSATDLLVSQALIEMQQSIAQLLRQFQLHRVSTSAKSNNVYQMRACRNMEFKDTLEET